MSIFGRSTGEVLGARGEGKGKNDIWQFGDI